VRNFTAKWWPRRWWLLAAVILGGGVVAQFSFALVGPPGIGAGTRNWGTPSISVDAPSFWQAGFLPDGTMPWNGSSTDPDGNTTKWWPNIVPGSTLYSRTNALGYTVQSANIELRGWLNSASNNSNGDPEFLYELELDPVWMTSIGLDDLNPVLKVGNILAHSNTTISDFGAVTNQGLVHVELLGWRQGNGSWTTLTDNGNGPPLTWQTYHWIPCTDNACPTSPAACTGYNVDQSCPYNPNCVYGAGACLATDPNTGDCTAHAGDQCAQYNSPCGVANCLGSPVPTYWAFDPLNIPGSPWPGYSQGPPMYVRMVGSLVTDGAHPWEAGSGLCSGQGIDCGMETPQDIALITWGGPHGGDDSQVNANRWTEMHSPDDIEILGNVGEPGDPGHDPGRHYTVITVAAEVPPQGSWMYAGVDTSTVDAYIQPPNDEGSGLPLFQEYVGSESDLSTVIEGNNGNNYGNTGAAITVVGAGNPQAYVQVHVQVHNNGSTAPGLFKAIYKVQWSSWCGQTIGNGCGSYAPLPASGNSLCPLTFAKSGTACNDNNINTYDDQCDGAGHCIGTPVTCPPNTTCASYSPNGTQSCTATPQNGGQPCSNITVAPNCGLGGVCAGTSVDCDGLPGAPTNPSTTVQDGQIYLSWTAPCGGSTYVVLRGTQSGVYTTTTNVSTATSLIDTNVTPGQTYHYAIVAYSAAGTPGQNSAEVIATAVSGGTALQLLASTPTASNSATAYTMGYQITPTKAITVTQLGAYVSASNGSNYVALFNASTGAALASAVVTGSNSWGYSRLGVPVNLEANTAYSIGVWFPLGGWVYEAMSLPVTNADLTINGSCYRYDAYGEPCSYSGLVTSFMYGLADMKYESYNPTVSLYSPIAPPIYGPYGSTYNMGFSFTTNKTLLVSALGAYVNAPRTVALYNLSGVQLGSTVTVTCATYPCWAYSPLPVPQTLGADQNFQVGVLTSSYYYDYLPTIPSTQNPDIAINNSCYSTVTTQSAPCVYNGGNYVYGIPDIQYSVPLSPWLYDAGNGLGHWYTTNTSESCNNFCSAHGGFSNSTSQHLGNAVGVHFWPGKANGSNWIAEECSSTDNNTNWGATNAAPDGTYSNAACHLNCSCGQ
jgi:hypothetical protein